jgi:ferric-dicitrate binding protein FerR (iron transport regulator)
MEYRLKKRMTMFQQRSATCDRARAWTSRRSDSELSEFECALLDAHLACCPACATFAEDVGSITSALRSAPLAKLSRPVDIAVRRRRSYRLPTTAAASAAAVVVTLAGAFAMLGSSGPKHPSLAQGTGNEDIRILSMIQRNQATKIFPANTVKVVHSAGTPARPGGGPVVDNASAPRGDSAAGK